MSQFKINFLKDPQGTQERENREYFSFFVKQKYLHHFFLTNIHSSFNDCKAQKVFYSFFSLFQITKKYEPL